MTAPTSICETASGAAPPGDPCTLSPAAMGHGFGDWHYLINHTPGLTMQHEIKTRFPTAESSYNAIEDAYGDINLDFYPIQILTMPQPFGVPMTPEQVLEHIRLHINDFIDHNKAKFVPYDEVIDTPRWRSPNAEGAVVSIAMNLPTKVGVVTPDCGSVLVSEHRRTHWIFSTLWTPEDLGHPVSGNRQFGYGQLRPADDLAATYDGVTFQKRSDDVLYIFSRGADRCTSVFDWVNGSVIFAGGHALWLSFQSHVAAWIGESGGTAVIPGAVSRRWDWDNDIVSNNLWPEKSHGLRLAGFKLRP